MLPIIAASVVLLVHVQGLCLATELFRTRGGHRRIRRLAPGCDGPATLLDQRSAIPGRRNLFEFGKLFHGARLVLELLDADRRQRDNDRGFSPLIGHLFGSAAKRPSEPAKAQDHDCYRTGHRTRCRRLARWMSFHLFTKGLGETRFSVADRPEESTDRPSRSASLGNYSDDARSERPAHVTSVPRVADCTVLSQPYWVVKGEDRAAANGRASARQPVNLPVLSGIAGRSGLLPHIRQSVQCVRIPPKGDLPLQQRRKIVHRAALRHGFAAGPR